MEEININKETKQQPMFEAVAQWPIAEVYKRGKALKSMPALETVQLKDGSSGEVLWLPEGFSKEHPTVRFAWLSPRSRELQRTADGVLPTDEFAQKTVLTIQRNTETGAYGATVTLVGMQRGATAVAAAEAAW